MIICFTSAVVCASAHFGASFEHANGCRIDGGMMKLMMTVLLEEKGRLEKELGSARNADTEKQLEVVNNDIVRLEMYIDRPDMQTWSELIFVDDIRQRVRQIQAAGDG